MHIYVKRNILRHVKDTRLATLGGGLQGLCGPDAACGFSACSPAGRSACATFTSVSAFRSPPPRVTSRICGAKDLVETRKEGLWVHYKLAPLDEPVMRVLMSAVTHVLCHCDAIAKDRQRLEKQTGCCVPADANASRMLRAGRNASTDRRAAQDVPNQSAVARVRRLEPVFRLEIQGTGGRQ